MQRKISKIANIISGYTFRGSIENELNGDIYVLQAKNIVLNNNVSDTNEFTKINSDSLRNPCFLEYNDILIVSRGSGIGSFRSTIFTSHKNNVITSSSVHTIRISDVTVLPKYVSLYLNSSKGQKAINKIVTGSSYIQSILVKNLSDLEIPIPSPHDQKLIIALNENMKKQEKIIERKQEIKQNIINSIFNNLTKK